MRTLQLLWEEYLREHPDGYQNSQFCYHFHFWRKSAEVSMHIDHKAGENLFVDYAGDRLAIVDPDSGKEQPVESSWRSSASETYVGQRQLGATAAAATSSRTTCAARSDAATVRARHQRHVRCVRPAYGVVIMPARVRQARDKALVENAVTSAHLRLQDRSTRSMSERGDQAAAGAAPDGAFSGCPIRRELFEQIERQPWRFSR